MNRSGFTLVELMIVSIIVSILAAVAVPLMSGNAKRAATTEAMAAIRVIKQAYRVHQAELAQYAYGKAVDLFPEIKPGDLDGTYFDEDSYRLHTTPGGYSIVCTPKDGAKHLDPLKDILYYAAYPGLKKWYGSLAP